MTATGRPKSPIIAGVCAPRLLASRRSPLTGMVLAIETGDAKAVRGTKLLISKASNQLGTKWQHWHFGKTVFAKPAEAIRRRGCRKATE